MRTLFDRCFDPCVDVAFRILHDPDEAAEIVEQTFLGAGRAPGVPRGSASFGMWALRTARDRALNRLSRRWRSTPPDGIFGLGMAGPGEGAAGAGAEVVDDTGELAGAMTAALGASDASLLDLHVRHGFDVHAIADALGLSHNEAHQLLFRLKRRLGAAVRAWVLWPDSHRGQPGCEGLQAAVESSGVRSFGPDAVQVIGHHTRACRQCQGRQTLRSSPEAMFAALPVVPAGSLLRDRTIAALESAGLALEPAAPPRAERPDSPTPTPTPTPTPSTSPTSTADPGASLPVSPLAGGPPDAPAPPPLPKRTPGRAWRPAPAGPRPSAAAAPASVSAAATPARSDAAPRPTGQEQPASGASATGAIPRDRAGASAGFGGGCTTPHHTGGPAHMRTGERAAVRPYEYQRTRADRRRLAGIGLAVAVVLGMSLAIVAVARGSSGTPPAAGSLTTTTSGGGGATAPDAGGSTTSAPPERPPPSQPGGTAPPAGEEPSVDGSIDAQDPPDQPARPEISGFQALEQSLGTPCAAVQRRIVLAWESSAATTARLDGPGAPTEPLPPTGRATACRDQGLPATYTLTVTGPGGTTFRTLTV
jgi:DNA-directed RNA polymerase specialized sigma24 family protein